MMDFLVEVCRLSAAFLFAKKSKYFFKVAKKFASLDFRMTPRKAKGGENRI